MKIFFRYQTRFRYIWFAKPSGRHFHKDHQLWGPLTLADFEAINRCEMSLPKNFNFAKDVLDQWSQKEKVQMMGSISCLRSIVLSLSELCSKVRLSSFMLFFHHIYSDAFLCFPVALFSPQGRFFLSSATRDCLSLEFPQPHHNSHHFFVTLWLLSIFFLVFCFSLGL